MSNSLLFHDIQGKILISRYKKDVFNPYFAHIEPLTGRLVIEQSHTMIGGGQVFFTPLELNEIIKKIVDITIKSIPA